LLAAVVVDGNQQGAIRCHRVFLLLRRACTELADGSIGDAAIPPDSCLLSEGEIARSFRIDGIGFQLKSTRSRRRHRREPGELSGSSAYGVTLTDTLRR
jgi:hypothetical protein